MEIALIKDSREEQKDFCFSIDFTIIRSVFPETRQVRIEDDGKLPFSETAYTSGTNCTRIKCTKYQADATLYAQL